MQHFPSSTLPSTERILRYEGILRECSTILQETGTKTVVSGLQYSLNGWTSSRGGTRLSYTGSNGKINGKTITISIDDTTTLTLSESLDQKETKLIFRGDEIELQEGRNEPKKATEVEVTRCLKEVDTILLAATGDIQKSPTAVRKEVEEAVLGAAQLTSVEVQGYALPVHVPSGYPEILRTDKKTTISLHPDDVDTFRFIREQIGTAIYTEKDKTMIDSNGVHISARLIAILKDHGIIVSSAGLGNFTVSWPK